jgi:peroxiredoxin Q/BCP
MTFKLLADPERQAGAAYGVPLMTFKDMKFDERDTFLIAPDGKIAQVWRKVDPQKDSTVVLAAIEQHSSH